MYTWVIQFEEKRKREEIFIEDDISGNKDSSIIIKTLETFVLRTNS